MSAEEYRIECLECGAIAFGGSHTDLETDKEWHRERCVPDAEFKVTATDGGHLPSDIRDGPHTVCPETGDAIPIESSTFTKLGLHAGDYEERYVELSFEDSVCDRCEAETEHRIETDWKRNRAKSECSECGLIETIRFTPGGEVGR